MLVTLSLLALLYVVLGGVIIAAGGGLVVSRATSTWRSST
jgi:hypothetical protein